VPFPDPPFSWYFPPSFVSFPESCSTSPDTHNTLSLVVCFKIPLLHPRSFRSHRLVTSFWSNRSFSLWLIPALPHLLTLFTLFNLYWPRSEYALQAFIYHKLQQKHSSWLACRVQGIACCYAGHCGRLLHMFLCCWLPHPLDLQDLVVVLEPHHNWGEKTVNEKIRTYQLPISWY